MSKSRVEVKVLVAGALTLLVVSLSGCGSGRSGSTDLSAVQRFDGYGVYWPGDRVKGLAVTDVSDDGHAGAEKVWYFTYGDCDPPDWPDEGGCALPLEVQNYPACRRWADAYPGKPRLFELRGAKAAWVPTAGSIEVYTGRTTVVIFANRNKVALTAARLLRDVRRGSAKPRLREPVTGSLWGDLPCQENPG